MLQKLAISHNSFHEFHKIDENNSVSCSPLAFMYICQN